MKRWTLSVIAAAAIAAPATAAERPRLVVQITFDQLRGDLLERYRPALRGGLKRVLDQGWWVRQRRSRAWPHRFLAGTRHAGDRHVSQPPWPDRQRMVGKGR